MLCSQVRTSEKTPILTCLLEGPPGTGKTALAATIGIDSQFPYVKLISAETMVGYSEHAKSSQIAKVFDDAYRVRQLDWSCMCTPAHLFACMQVIVSTYFLRSSPPSCMDHMCITAPQSM